MEGIQPTYNLADRGYDGFGMGGSGIWLFAILALLWGGFGGRYGAEGRVATVEDLNNSANFTRLESQVQGNGQAIASGFTNLSNGICQLGYQLATDKGELAKQMAIDTASINATTTAQTQKILDVIAQNKIESLQAQVNQLYIDKQLCGVVRYPTSSTYFSANPFCGCGFSGNI